MAPIAVFPDDEVTASIVLLNVFKDSFVYLFIRMDVHLPIVIGLNFILVYRRSVVRANYNHTVDKGLISWCFLLKDTALTGLPGFI